MKKVVLRGPVLTQSGYGVHSRQVARWLIERDDIEVKFIATPWGDTPWILDRNAGSGIIGKIMERTVGPDYSADVSFQVQLPNEWDPKLSQKNIGITASVETDRCNPEWVSACNSMTAVVFPSEHSKSSVTSTGALNVPVHLIPESYSDEILKVDGSLPLDVDTSFNFLLFGQLTGNNPYNDRKNMLFTLKWIFESFKDDPEVGVIIKTNAGRNTKIDRNLVLRVLNSVIKETRKGPYPRVHLLHGEMSDEDVCRLYRNETVKALVSLTRGEGYGLPILEAAATGLPVIATNWSGHLDFMKHTKFIPVEHTLTKIHPTRADGKIFMPESMWAEPSEADFKKKILKFRGSPAAPRDWAREGSSKIRELYSFSSIKAHYDQAFEQLFT